MAASSPLPNYAHDGYASGKTIILGSGDEDASTSSFWNEPGAMPPLGAAPNVAPQAALMPSAAVNEQATMTEYRLQGKWQVKSDDQGSLVDIMASNLSVSYICRTVPRLDTGVYLVASLQDAANVSFPQSSASVYLEGSYVGDVSLDLMDAEGKLELPLGRDTQIAVKRTEKRREISQTIFKGNTRVAYGYEVDITNYKRGRISMEVLDQIPVSRDRAITVDVQNLSNGLLNEQTGEVSWKFILEPGQTVAIHLEYTVSYPKGERIS